jgi:hypothetical protein
MFLIVESNQNLMTERRRMPDPSCKRYPKSTESERQSFQMAGPQLLFTPPRTLRDLKKTTIEEFKEKLYQFLATLPDHP